jgi:hypothetical protein
MKIIITKKQYKSLITNLLDVLLGKISLLSAEQKYLSNRDKSDFHSVLDEFGNEVMSIWISGPKNKGCKYDLTLDPTFMENMEKYFPHYKHKLFSKVLVDYVYKHTGIKCDCVQYDYGFEIKRTIDDEGEEYTVDLYNTKRYNVKKKKKIGESVDDRQSLDEIIYDFLKDDFYPDYDWGPELFDFYDEEVRVYGSTTFHIDDSEAYIYYDDGTLEIMPWVCEKLNEYFNDSWYSVFKSWFEKNSGLKVDRIVDSTDDDVLLGESTDKNKKLINGIVGFDFSNRITQITSSYDVPMNFDECFGSKLVKGWLNFWGPMYLFEFDGVKYLYQDRGEYEVFVDEHCVEYVENEIPEEIGIGILGLRFSDIINMYFEEEEY